MIHNLLTRLHPASRCTGRCFTWLRHCSHAANRSGCSAPALPGYPAPGPASCQCAAGVTGATAGVCHPCTDTVPMWEEGEGRCLSCSVILVAVPPWRLVLSLPVRVCGNLSVFVGSVFTRIVAPHLSCMLAQLVLADFGVSHQLSAVVEGLGPSAVSAAGRAGTSLTGESLTCTLHRCVLLKSARRLVML
jgi:hypothetical protein